MKHSESKMVYDRQTARDNKDFTLSDHIRDELDVLGTIVFDTKDGQEIYYTVNKTRDQVVESIKEERRAEAMFDAWLFSKLKTKNT